MTIHWRFYPTMQKRNLECISMPTPYKAVPPGGFCSYRTYALAQGWAKEKTEAQWVLLDRVENTRRRWIQNGCLAICWEMSCVWLAIRTSLQQKAMQWMLRPKRITRLCIITVRIPGQSTVTTSALFPLSVIICIVQETLP